MTIWQVSVENPLITPIKYQWFDYRHVKFDLENPTIQRQVMIEVKFKICIMV